MLKMRYESADQIPEGLQDHYQETDDGVFVLQIDGAKPQSDYKAVEKALSNERKIREKYESIAKDLGVKDEDGEIDEDKLDSIKQAVNAYENRRNDDGEETIDGETKEQIERRIASKYEKELGKKNEKIEKLNGRLETTLIDNGLEEQLSKAGITNPAYRRAVKNMLRPDITLKEDGDETKAVGGVLEKDLETYVKEFAESEEGKEFVTGKRNSGGGSGGSGGGEDLGQNPFKKETFNLSKIGELARNNKEKAKALAREAGVDPKKYGIE